MLIMIAAMGATLRAAKAASFSSIERAIVLLMTSLYQKKSWLPSGVLVSSCLGAKSLRKGRARAL